jgi:hypothetical protein
VSSVATYVSCRLEAPPEDWADDPAGGPLVARLNAQLPPHVRAGATADVLRRLKPEAVAEAASASPTAAIAAGPAAAGDATVVLSTAPLMGAAPAVDPGNPRWLHVEVRPALSALLRLLGATAPGSELQALGRQLSSGHWVLSFPAEGPAGAAAAVESLSEAARGMRAVYAQVMAPLLGGATPAQSEPRPPEE